MAWHHVERTFITSPRALHRPDQTSRPVLDKHGKVIRHRTPEAPSVGGSVTWYHDVWRCGHCRAIACTGGQDDGEQTPPPGKCMKCKP
jgi:hypothetical protein